MGAGLCYDKIVFLYGIASMRICFLIYTWEESGYVVSDDCTGVG